MRGVHLGALVALAGFYASAIAAAKPSASINCAVQSLSAKQQTDAGAALLDDQAADVATRVHNIVAKPARACAKINRWTDAQTETAISWSIWDLMGAEIERRSGLTPADFAIMYAYADEDPTRIEKLNQFTPAQVSNLIHTLQQRGAHLHNAGKNTERELSALMIRKEINAEAKQFAGM